MESQKRHQRIGGADGGERIASENASDDQGVGNVVKLLQQISCDHRQGKQDKRAGDFPAGQIVIHKETSFRT